MAGVMKVQINIRLDHDTNTSVSFEHMLDTEEEARQAGEEDFKLHQAYMEGMGQYQP